MKKSDPRTIFLKDYSASNYLIEKTRLYFDLRDDYTLVTSTLAMYKNPDVKTQSNTLVLDGADLELLEISIDGETLDASSWEQTETSLTIRDLAERFTLTTQVKIYPHKNTILEGLYKTGDNYCTQCEAEGFRRITWYLDRPDVMSLFSVAIEAQQATFPILLSNGNKSNEEAIGGGRYIVSWEDPFRKPAYLFALVAGDYACLSRQYVTQSGRDVALNIYTEAHNIDKTEHAMNSLVNAMRWDEERFGLEYDLDIYNVVATDDFNMGAMENKGLNVFNSKYVLASHETATDADYIGIEGVIGHEYFHNWTGNRVTCRDWFQLSLKEGLTVFRDQEFTADMNSAVSKRIEDANFLRGHQYAEDAGPMAHPIRPPSYIEINNFYTLTVYEKGAQVVRIYQSILGKEGFRKGMDLYFKRHDGEAVTTEDFLAAMADANGEDLSLMQRWYDQAGTPELEVTDHWDEEKKTYRLVFTQHIPEIKDQPTHLPVPIPLALGLLDQDGVDIDLSLHSVQFEGMKVMTTEHLELSFENIVKKPVVSLLRDFSAPVKVRFDYSDEQLVFLARHDSDMFNRWQACQALASSSLVDNINRLDKGQSVKINEPLFSLFGSILAENNTPQLKADLLLLPGENILAEEMEVIQPELIHSARMNLKSAIATQLYPQLMNALGENSGAAGNAIDPENMGRRKMLSVILDYLLATGEADAKAAALKCYQQASCMTEIMAAMKPLVHTGCEEGEVVLRDFELRWIDESLVMDKWFSLQATVPSDSSLEVVATLMSHSGFSIKNPNRVRAVIGAFANANPTQFHRPDGAGYQFIADQVLELNTINPMIAARLAKSFSRWRRYDQDRQGLMHAQLERIVKVEGLSKDVYEIVSKSLQ